MKTALVIAGTLLLVGCASAPRPQVMVIPPKAPIVKALPAPAVEAPVAPLTFKERFKKFTGKLRWTHQ